MRIKHHFRIGGAILTVLALCALLYTPAQAASSGSRFNGRTASATSVNANIYLTGQMLQPLFQGDLNQQMPSAVANAIASMVGQLPKADQAWGAQMADALLQPSATVVSLKPESGGLLTTLRVNLYSGDPKPTTSSLLIGFKVINATTVQISALGNSGLVSGPLLTFHVPIGTLNSVAATPNCGDSDLNINLKFPVTLGNAIQASTQGSSATTPLSYEQAAAPASAPGAYVEVPASSLAQLGGTVGNISVTSTITAKSVQVYTQGNDLVTKSRIYWEGIYIGTAVSTMAPGASGGNLVVNVLETDMEYFDGLISFPVNKYNSEIQQIINAKFNGALTNRFVITQASIGFNSHLPCASSSSLVLGGTINLN